MVFRFRMHNAPIRCWDADVSTFPVAVTANLWQICCLCLYCLRAYNLSVLYSSRTIEVGADRFKIPDILFNPYLSQVSGKSIIFCVHVHTWSRFVLVVNYTTWNRTS
jgi:hypothetical protein